MWFAYFVKHSPHGKKVWVMLYYVIYNMHQLCTVRVCVLGKIKKFSFELITEYELYVVDMNRN